MTEETSTRENTSVLFFRSEEILVEKRENAIINDSNRAIGQLIIYTILCLSIDVFGTITNILNIICFIKQGFKDPVNVSLLGLAISDLGCLVPLIWTNICMAPQLSAVDLPFDPEQFQYLTGAWPHITFTRVSSWMTALITLERCLCVTAPLQVKNLVTPKRVAIITTCVYTVLIASVAPIYTVNKVGMTFIPSRNRTVIGLQFADNRESVEKISFAVNNVFLSFVAFMIIIVCTIILVIKLKASAKWRNASATATKSTNGSNRNQKASKMVVMISTLFIACFVPIVIVFTSMTIEPEISINGQHRNLATILAGMCLLLESINSSMNIFIYFHMSSKYKAAFRQLFCYSTRNELESC